MKKGLIVLFGFLLPYSPTITAVGRGATTEQNHEAAILITPAQLQRILNGKNLRLLDVRTEQEYAKGHIPGALRVDVGDWKTLAVTDNGLRDVGGWTEKVRPLGLQNETHVVVYGRSLTDTARIWWLLKYVGVENVSILDGGWDWWIKHDRPTQRSAPIVTVSDFKPNFQADRMQEMDSINKSLNSAEVQLVDTRSIGEFSGGRIPGSAHLEWKELVAEDGRLKTPTQLQQLFRERGIVPSETAVCY